MAQTLTLPLSAALLAKLRASAEDEGVTIEQLATELLSEGVVLRAWEIIERKNAMRAPSHGNGHGHGNGNGHHGNRRPQANVNWMEDRAAFLEYVRNQEKRGR